MSKALDTMRTKVTRQKHNLEIIQRMRSGDSLQRYSAQSSWYPPRPVVKKDSDAIQFLYGGKRESLVEVPETI